MKHLSFLLGVLITAGSYAQDGAMEGVDAYFMEEGYYDNLADAVSNAEGALYLDLSLQSPKLTKIPADVYKLKNLKYLELGFNQIGALDDGISELSSLEVIGLDGNKYLKAVSAEVYEMKNLKELHLKDTGLSNDQLDVVKSRLPLSCKLFR